MNAKVKITIRETTGQVVALVVRGNANEHASGLLEKASAEALRLIAAAQRTAPSAK